MSDIVKRIEISAEESALLAGDLSKLSTEQRSSLYIKVCQSLGLNPLTQPFNYILLNGKLQLYATKNCTDQLRQIHNVSLKISSRERLGELYIVTSLATTASGRTDESTGAVTIGHLKGDALANGLMKAETKAKRRVTLSICGLSMLDESELETVRDAKIINQIAQATNVEESAAEEKPKPLAVTPEERILVVKPEAEKKVIGTTKRPVEKKEDLTDKLARLKNEFKPKPYAPNPSVPKGTLPYSDPDDPGPQL
jgi:hypothetical protein